ncbi:MAG TPA: GntR family transcriptional regulator [Candidatus Dormibacteraeota bacterium]
MRSPPPVVDPDDPLPPYEQIRVQIRRRIATGRLAPAAPLPSVRQLARDLGVAPNTVARAYGELASEGWIIALPRRRVVVAVQPPRTTSEERTRQLTDAVSDLLVTAHELGAKSAELLAEIHRQLAVRGPGSAAE